MSSKPETLNNLVSFGDSNYQPLADVLASLEGLVPFGMSDKNASAVLLDEPLPGAKIIPGGVAVSSAGWFFLGRIICYGADGMPFETHDKIFVAKDVIREIDGTYQLFTPYQAITHFEAQGNGEFLPSFALSCNILATIFERAVKKTGNTYTTLDAELKTVLDQYKDHGAGWGYQAQNTIVQWDRRNSKIIHYPDNTQFTVAGVVDVINQQGYHKELEFNPTNKFGDVLLEEALNTPEFAKYVKNLTGLQNPLILSEIGAYFGKPAKIWLPNNPSTVKDNRAAWLGCNNCDFLINTCDILIYNYGARGVRRE